MEIIYLGIALVIAVYCCYYVKMPYYAAIAVGLAWPIILVGIAMHYMGFFK